MSEHLGLPANPLVGTQPPKLPSRYNWALPPTMAAPNPKGLQEPGNLSIWSRPTVQNSNGSHSSEYSTSFQDENGKEVLVPSVVGGKFLTPTGEKPPEGSPEEKEMFKRAWQHYGQTGENLGKFDTPENADVYSEQLHNRPSARPQMGNPPEMAAPGPISMPDSKAPNLAITPPPAVSTIGGKKTRIC